MSEAEAKMIVGTLKSWPFPNQHGWMRFEVDVGKQWPVKLDTKIEAIIEQVRKLGTAEGAWHFNESDGNPNPNQPGTFYKNRLLSKVEPAGEATVSATAVSAVPAQNDEKVDWDAKERRDYRSRAWAQTISAFVHTIRTEESVDEVFQRLQPFQRKVYQDITGNFAYPQDNSDLPEALQGGAYDEPDPAADPDSDIPF